jgi:hypothetical protein
MREDAMSNWSFQSADPPLVRPGLDLRIVAAGRGKVEARAREVVDLLRVAPA